MRYHFFIILLLITGPAWSQLPTAKNPIDAEKHYREVADAYLKFLTEKNLEGILSLYADNATVKTR